jgi:hypothetical protein
VSLAARALALTTSALIEDAIIVLPFFRLSIKAAVLLQSNRRCLQLAQAVWNQLLRAILCGGYPLGKASRL